jgi:hypothetical protein
VPFSVFDGQFDANRNGTFNDRSQYVGPSGVYTGATPANGYIRIGTPTSPNFVDLTSCSTAPICEGTAQGQLARGAFTGPKYVDADLSVAKRFKIYENAGLTFQAGFFNLFNHPNFAIPDQNTVDAIPNLTNNTFGGTFGQSTSTFAPGQGGARVTQLALRFDF